ncbi:MAG TPA: hypothetical protein PLU22_00905 [Polyangiaceae bacterium]|nr:hypothetical protein [Polyangiaceae bacterium]
MTATEPSLSEPSGVSPAAVEREELALEAGTERRPPANRALERGGAVPEPAPVLRRTLTALWVGFLPLWLVILALVTPSVPVVLAAFGLFVLLVLRLQQSLRRFRCPRCGGRYYARDLFALLGGTRCAGCGR